MPRAVVRARRGGAVLAMVALAATCWGVAASASSGNTGRVATVRVTFEGKGGGRYLDTTHYLREDTRECYARRIADETISVAWQVTWTAPLQRDASGYTVGAPTPGSVDVTATVSGTQVRDSCDSVEEEPGWNLSATCESALPIVDAASMRPRQTPSALILSLRAPRLGSPDRPCELDVRNDQLVAHARITRSSLARVAQGQDLAVPVGARHPGPGDNYLGTRRCSHFPHIYDGVVYIYDCVDTLVWNGTLTVAPA